MESIQQAGVNASTAGVSDNTQFYVWDAIRLPFAKCDEKQSAPAASEMYVEQAVPKRKTDIPIGSLHARLLKEMEHVQFSDVQLPRASVDIAISDLPFGMVRTVPVQVLG